MYVENRPFLQPSNREEKAQQSLGCSIQAGPLHFPISLQTIIGPHNLPACSSSSGGALYSDSTDR
jgi:hypothetical protein